MRNGYVSGAAMGILLLMAASMIVYVSVKLTNLYHKLNNKCNSKVDLDKWMKG